AAESFIQSQKAEGWVCLPESYDDGGFSGGNMERPALRKLMDDVNSGRIDTVVVYKIDRLSRSLLDFSEIIGAFDKHGVTFVSVTQQFNTTTSMGRLTLNILLSFAQFEREIIGERIRDKVAMAKRRGKQTGGMLVLGYDLVDGKLVVNESEAKIVRRIFARFLEIGSATRLTKELREQGMRTKAWTTKRGKVREGRLVDKSLIYRMLNNRKYLGEVVHKGEVFQGEHKAIIDAKTWGQVQTILKQNYRQRANQTRRRTPAMLKGIIKCGNCGGAMGPTYSKKGDKQYRYYQCVKSTKLLADHCPVRSVAAGIAEDAVVKQLRAVLSRPEIIAPAARAAQEECPDITEPEVAEALRSVDAVWEALFPMEQARIVQLLVEQIVVTSDGLDIRIRTNGLRGLMHELQGATEEANERTVERKSQRNAS
ncbi:MAG: recombinase family protein, partial [Lentisphaerae bacterium]|nr:recombinase family protein [Lentisphaerota bacterium]